MIGGELQLADVVLLLIVFLRSVLSTQDSFGPTLRPRYREHPIRQGRQHHIAQHKGTQQCKGLGEGQGLEHLSFLRLHGKDGQEADDSGSHGGQHGTRHFRCRFADQVFEFLATQVYGAVASSRLLLHAPDDVLHEDHPHIDHHADGNGNARQGYDIGFDADQLHHNEGREHGQGKHGANDDRSTQVDDEYQYDYDADHDFVQQGILEGANGLLDELGTVVEGHHRHLRSATVGKFLFGQTG